ncbi:hypothetical protein [Lentibacillus salicampi]|uniref:Core-binding (CB) domain-containing protein n=1 Tax=Lentibacillus salicampi TaxID=175306 RepID=A0A4Y9A7G3_9BACI|nr:hypothetical protein [Lentibacillus salicampi]TFJ91663.1 hypothetical protein E4U82_16440 [Lentibacillus salicampi]
MKSIDKILEEFLQEQHNRLKDKTYRDYESVIDLFRDYLNMYAPNSLHEDDRKRWEAEFDEDEDCYTRMFGPDYLDESDFEEFLDYFMIRKVASSESFMKVAVRVMKKLNKWLFENKYFDQDDYVDAQEYFGEANDLPDVEKLADLIFDYSRMTMDTPFEDKLEGYFTVVDIKPGQLWVKDAFDGGKTIGPVQVSKQISDLCNEGWDINFAIGLYQEKWYIVESGNVYR